MLNSIGNSDMDRLCNCFNSKKCKIALYVRNVKKKSLVSLTRQNTRNLSVVTETGESVLNRAAILLFNCIQSSFLLCNGFSNRLNEDRFPFVTRNHYRDKVNDIQESSNRFWSIFCFILRINEIALS